ncbi:serpin family protein [Halovivax gelatinilyticus]|uniref:serpin family protein n=1 Tax=Halovivax gelatinilyticus TaxID=2961597 RepID=UPI0020CA6B75|nr:serpin family protein [Halovivax gelatinilyticus]
MDSQRRRLLALSGALAATSLAGCLSGGDDDSDDGTNGTDDDSSGDDSPDNGDPPTAGPSVDDERLAELAAGNAAFALDLHRQVADGNTFISPYSISAALAMTYAGAAGETETQMRETLRYTLGDDVHPAIGDLEAALESRETTEPVGGDDDEDAFQLSLANALWAQEGFPFHDEYFELVETYYGAGIEQADFAGDPDGERERINDWVADQTEDRIDELLPDGSIDDLTRLVLTNAIYFMANWADQFDPDDTEDAAFTALDGAESTVPMMSQNLRTDYTEWNGHEAIELPYVGGEVSMVLLLPAEGEFEDFERELTAEELFGIFDDLGDASGDLRLPRFEIDTDVQLAETLAEMGMPDAFDEVAADFTGMSPEGDRLYIDDVYHEAFVAVDEEGTEATGATAVVINFESAPARSFDLTFDRPFLFCIRDKPTDAVLFFGRVTDAGAAQAE